VKQGLKADAAFQSTCEQLDRLWFMLRCVASKRWMRLLNKLNKSSIIHPGLRECRAHVDQRRVPAACNIPQWKHRSAGKSQQIVVNTGLCARAWEFCANTAATPVLRIQTSLMSGAWSGRVGGLADPPWRLDTFSARCRYLGANREKHTVCVNNLMQYQ